MAWDWCAMLFFASYVALLTYHAVIGVGDDFQAVDHTHLNIPEGLPKLPDTESMLKDTGSQAPVVPMTTKFEDPNLHPEHYPYYFTQHPEEAEICRQDDGCLHKVGLFTYYNFHLRKRP